MKALRGTLAESAAATLAAGCDLTLHCSGVLSEMEEIAPAVAPLGDAARRRLESAARWMRQGRADFDFGAELALTQELPAP
jgi:beta-N-acetylhexosaminidase